MHRLLNSKINLAYIMLFILMTAKSICALANSYDHVKDRQEQEEISNLLQSISKKDAHEKLKEARDNGFYGLEYLNLALDIYPGLTLQEISNSVMTELSSIENLNDDSFKNSMKRMEALINSLKNSNNQKDYVIAGLCDSYTNIDDDLRDIFKPKSFLNGIEMLREEVGFNNSMCYPGQSSSYDLADLISEVKDLEDNGCIWAGAYYSWDSLDRYLHGDEELYSEVECFGRSENKLQIIMNKLINTQNEEEKSTYSTKKEKFNLNIYTQHIYIKYPINDREILLKYKATDKCLTDFHYNLLTEFNAMILPGISPNFLFESQESNSDCKSQLELTQFKGENNVDFKLSFFPSKTMLLKQIKKY